MFLKCKPCVFVVGNQYEIVINTAENGIIGVSVGGQIYYEENSGALYSEKNFAKIRVPQCVLDGAEKYAVEYRKTIIRRGYGSLMDEKQRVEFEFKPLKKTQDIKIYHVADVHYNFEIFEKVCSFFGNELDLLVVNGDIGEVETIENYEDVLKFVGNISNGKIPVIFSRGNHDVRGHLAERFTDYFPANGKKTYFNFEVGCLKGIVLDCGEDKRDDHIDRNATVPDVYGGVNIFHDFRLRERDFLQNLIFRKDDKITFAVSHISPSYTTSSGNPVFDIEREVYAEWIKELERLGIKFMLTGHLHKVDILPAFDERSILPANYPVIVGSECYKGKFMGTAITLNKDGMKVQFTDQELHVVSEQWINF